MVEKVKRPWGSFEVVERGPRYWVKKIIVKRNQRTSLQFHKGRAELHFVVSGQVRFDLPEMAYKRPFHILKAGESIFIPATHQHRIHNIGVSHAQIIEVAFGSCAEKDIVRVEDDYGRVGKK